MIKVSLWAENLIVFLYYLKGLLKNTKKWVSFMASKIEFLIVSRIINF